MEAWEGVRGEPSLGVRMEAVPEDTLRAGEAPVRTEAVPEESPREGEPSRPSVVAVGVRTPGNAESFDIVVFLC